MRRGAGPPRRPAHPTPGGTMPDLETAETGAEAVLEMGPIDYIVIEWPGRQPDGSVAPLILDLVDRGLVRILDFAFVGKDENGSIYAIDIAETGGFGEFEGATSGLMSPEDL